MREIKIGGFHPGERDCCISTIKMKIWVVEDSLQFPSRRAGLLYFHADVAGIYEFELQRVSIPASGIVVFPQWQVASRQSMSTDRILVSIPASGIVGEQVRGRIPFALAVA